MNPFLSDLTALKILSDSIHIKITLLLNILPIIIFLLILFYMNSFDNSLNLSFGSLFVKRSTQYFNETDFISFTLVTCLFVVGSMIAIG